MSVFCTFGSYKTFIHARRVSEVLLHATAQESDPLGDSCLHAYKYASCVTRGIFDCSLLENSVFIGAGGRREWACPHKKMLFCVLLTVLPSIIFCKLYQVGAQIFLICLLLFSTCFGQLCAHHQEKIPYLCDTWYLSLYIDDCLLCRAEFPPCIPYSHLYRVTNIRFRIGTVFSPDDGHIVARNM